MATLPSQSGSAGTWGTELDAWAAVHANTDGTLKASAVQTALGGSLPAIDACGAGYGAAPSATAAANSTAIQNAINDAALLGSALGKPAAVSLSIAGQYAIGTGLQMKSNVVVEATENEWSVYNYNASPQNYQTTSLIADGTAGAVVVFATTVHDASLRNLMIVGNGRVGVSLPATTNRNGNRLRNVYVTGASTGISCLAAETRMEKILVLLSTANGVEIDGLDCQIDDLVCGFNGGHGVVVGIATPATSANVLRGKTWDIFNNTGDGIQLNGDAHRLLDIQTNNNNQRGLAFLTCTKTVITGFRGLDNGREYDGATHLTRYPDVEFAHPTAGNAGCGIVGGSLASTDAKQSVAIKNSEAVVSYPLLDGIGIGGSYSGGAAASNLISSINAFTIGVVDPAGAFFVPKGGIAGLRTRSNGSADQFQVTDGSGNAWAGAKANGSIFERRNTPTYSASITPDASAGNFQTITPTNGTAFTINAPTNPPSATQTQRLTIEIANGSGGAMGAITWNAAFKLVGGAFTNPANGFKRLIHFEWNGASWVEISRSSADYT